MIIIAVIFLEEGAIFIIHEQVVSESHGSMTFSRWKGRSIESRKWEIKGHNEKGTWIINYARFTFLRKRKIADHRPSAAPYSLFIMYGTISCYFDCRSFLRWWVVLSAIRIWCSGAKFALHGQCICDWLALHEYTRLHSTRRNFTFILLENSGTCSFHLFHVLHDRKLK